MILRLFLLVCAFFSCSSVAKMDLMDNMFAETSANKGADEKGSHMTGEFGVQLNNGNTAGTTLTARLDANQQLEHWYNTFVVDTLYKQNERDVDGERERVTSAQQLFTSAQLEYKLNEQHQRLFVYGAYDQDRFNQYDYQTALAVGWTEQLWKESHSQFRYSIGPGYARSKLVESLEGQDQNGMIVRASMEYKRELGTNAEFRQFLSTEADGEFSRSVSETSVSANISKAMAMKVALNMVHNRSAQNLGAVLSTETSFTLVYHFF